MSDSTIAASAPASPSGAARVTSIDALRGLVMFTMIFVNDIAGASTKVVPAWMRHFHGKDGMTFVDLVFPGFLFIVGMSIPFALGSRLNKGEPLWKTLWHIATRTFSLLAIGILMVNETPDAAKMGWSGGAWATLMYFSAILAFCTLSPNRKSAAAEKTQETYQIVSLIMRGLGMISLVFLAFAYRGEDGHRIISLSPFSIHKSWYGILGLIGWAYLAGSLVYLFARNNRTTLLACGVLLLCFYPADRAGFFDHFPPARIVSFGGTLGSLPSITVLGILLATILITPDTSTVRARTRFSLLFIAACAAGAMLLHGLYGINKNNATPSWCLWSCAITAAIWLVLYFLTDVRPVGFISKPLSIAGQNVLLAYLLSDLLPSAIDWLQWWGWYGGLANSNLACAIARSAGCAIFLLAVTAGLNRLGFRLKL